MTCWTKIWLMPQFLPKNLQLVPDLPTTEKLSRRTVQQFEACCIHNLYSYSAQRGPIMFENVYVDLNIETFYHGFTHSWINSCWLPHTFELTSCDESAFGVVQIGLPSKVKIFNDEHRHKNSTWVMSLTLLLMIKWSVMFPHVQWVTLTNINLKCRHS